MTPNINMTYSISAMLKVLNQLQEIASQGVYVSTPSGAQVQQEAEDVHVIVIVIPS